MSRSIHTGPTETFDHASDERAENIERDKSGNDAPHEPSLGPMIDAFGHRP